MNQNNRFGGVNQDLSPSGRRRGESHSEEENMRRKPRLVAQNGRSGKDCLEFGQADLPCTFWEFPEGLLAPPGTIWT